MDSISLFSWYTKLLCRVRIVFFPLFARGDEGEKKGPPFFPPENKVAKKEKIEYHRLSTIGLASQDLFHRRVANSMVEYSAFNRLVPGSSPGQPKLLCRVFS